VKWCGKCGQFKSRDEFYNNRTHSDGKQVYCKTCWKVYEVKRQSLTIGKRCAFDGCQRMSSTAVYCAAHRRQRSSGSEMSSIPSRLDRIRITGPGTQCLVSDCVAEVHSRGWCLNHYTLWKNDRPVTSINEAVPCEGCGADLVRSDRRQMYCAPCKTLSLKMRSYGLKARDWFRMLAEQGGVCAIPSCGESDSSKFHVDHDHNCCPGTRACGKCVRGLLCHLCNIAAGSLGDDPERVDGLASYLRATKVAAPYTP
jgi:hypothetical protein